MLDADIHHEDHEAHEGAKSWKIRSSRRDAKLANISQAAVGDASARTDARIHHELAKGTKN